MNIACIGTGVIVERMIQSVLNMDDIHVIAVYSRTMTKAKNFAKKFSIEHAYDNLNAMLNNSNIDAVYIASPNSLHFEHTIMTLNHGKHAFIEKPIVGNEDRIRKIYDLAKEKHLFVFETIYSLYLPNFKVLEREIKNIGAIRLVEANFSKVSSRYKDLIQGDLPNVFNPEFSGGALADLNIYNLHVIFKLFSQPKQINYQAHQHANGIDLSGVLTLEYADKLVVCMASKESGDISKAVFLGDQGHIEILGGLNRIETIKVYKEGTCIEFDEQSNHHMSYEFIAFKKMIDQNDFAKMLDILEHSIGVVSMAAQARKQINLNFEY